MKKLLTLTAGLVIGLSASLTAHANDFYVGATGGLETNNYINMVDANAWNVHDSIMATRVKAGYDFNENLGLEIGGLVSRHITIESLMPSNVVTFNQQIVDGLAKLSMTSGHITIAGKGGVAYVFRNDCELNGSKCDSDLDNLFTGAVGANLDYSLTKNFIIDTEYMHYFKRESFPGTDYLGAGFIYKF